ncbi:hypothetical protein CEXT_711971 [Caerostris extrusa]|uniref:Uncharacterized protein n=1 Tax=Caerostris extrusa TaxID=172846 RepID=A0AAV4PL93_CAEEX|nr:hypothetical protein CEXT_711971 [Caerostris extrusa]
MIALSYTSLKKVLKQSDIRMQSFGTLCEVVRGVVGTHFSLMNINSRVKSSIFGARILGEKGSHECIGKPTHQT